jgi:hypothetical protein
MSYLRLIGMPFVMFPLCSSIVDLKLFVLCTELLIPKSLAYWSVARLCYYFELYMDALEYFLHYGGLDLKFCHCKTWHMDQ